MPKQERISYRLAGAFHPLKFEKGVYAVQFNETGKPLLDKYTKFTQVMASSRAAAIRKAQKEFGIFGRAGRYFKLKEVI